MANRPSSHYPDIGVLGEELVAHWLRATGWVVLHRRWRCRWGEIDIIARQEPQENSLPITPHSPHSSHLLVFVEVKTRSRGNWDAGGLLSITPQKQAKLWQTARCFLATYPHLADYPCQFDVALVGYQRLSTSQHQSAKALVTLEASPGSACKTFQLGQAVSLAGYQLILQEYISSAFD